MLFRILIAVALVIPLAPFPSFAGGEALESDYVGPGLGSILPYRGVYYERGRGGTGMFLDVSLRGDLFISFYASTEEGAPTYYLMQGVFEQSSDQVRIETGVIGTSHPDLYVSRGGECIEGSECPFREPTREAVDLPVEIVWLTPRHATVTIGSKSFDFRAAEFVGPDGSDLADSLWWITYGLSSPLYPDVAGEVPVRSSMALVRLQAVSYPDGAVSIAPAAREGYAPPPEGSQWYLLSCAGEYGTCAGLYSAASIPSRYEGIPFPLPKDTPYRFLLWYDSSSLRAGLQIVKLDGDGVILGLPGAYFSEVYFDGPQRIVGRGERDVASADEIQGMMFSLLMRRMPDTHVRNAIVCPAARLLCD